MSTSLDWWLYLWHLYRVCLVTYIPLKQCPELTFAVYFTTKAILFPVAYVALQYLAVLSDLISFHLPLLRGLQTLWPSSSSLYTPNGHFFHPASPCGVGRVFIPGLGKLLSYILIFGSQFVCVLLRVTSLAAQSKLSHTHRMIFSQYPTSLLCSLVTMCL